MPANPEKRPFEYSSPEIVAQTKKFIKTYVPCDIHGKPVGSYVILPVPGLDIPVAFVGDPTQWRTSNDIQMSAKRGEDKVQKVVLKEPHPDRQDSSIEITITPTGEDNPAYRFYRTKIPRTHRRDDI